MKHLENLVHSTDTERILTFLDAVTHGRVADVHRLADSESICAALNHTNLNVVFHVFRLLPGWIRQGLVTIAEISDTEPFHEIPEDDITEALGQEPISVRFPVVDFDEAVDSHIGELAEALVFPWGASGSVAFPRHMSIPPKQSSSGKTAFVVFDRKTQGDSQQLSVSVAIETGCPSNSVLFTGTVGQDGSVGQVDHWHEKDAACRKADCVLLGATHLNTVKEAVSLVTDSPLQLPVLFHVHKQDPGNSMHSLLNACMLPYPADAAAVTIHRETTNLTWKHLEMLPRDTEAWLTAVESCRNWLKNLKTKSESRPILLHLGMRMPADLAFALGSIMKGDKGFEAVPYHFSNETYVSVAGATATDVRCPEAHDVKLRTGEKRGTVFGIQLGQEDICNDLVAWSERTGSSLVLLKLKESQPVPIGNWEPLARKIVEMIHNHMTPGSQLTLNTPVALAFLIGKEFGFKKSLDILHMEHGEYFPAYNTNDLRALAL